MFDFDAEGEQCGGDEVHEWAGLGTAEETREGGRIAQAGLRLGLHEGRKKHL